MWNHDQDPVNTIVIRTGGGRRHVTCDTVVEQRALRAVARQLVAEIRAYGNGALSDDLKRRVPPIVGGEER
jgi:hypothetical protein